MVSTLHITLSYNQPGGQVMGRSVSCEETNLVGFASSSLGTTTRNASLSTSSVLSTRAATGYRDSKPPSVSSLLAPTPYSPVSTSKTPSWSPVRFKPNPLPDALRNFGSSHFREAVVDKGSSQPVWATRQSYTKLAVVSPSLTADWSSCDTRPADSSDTSRAASVKAPRESPSAAHLLSPRATRGPSPSFPQGPSPSATQGPSHSGAQGNSPTACQGPSPSATQGPSPSTKKKPSPGTKKKPSPRTNKETSLSTNKEPSPRDNKDPCQNTNSEQYPSPKDSHLGSSKDRSASRSKKPHPTTEEPSHVTNKEPYPSTREPSLRTNREPPPCPGTKEPSPSAAEEQSATVPRRRLLGATEWLTFPRSNSSPSSGSSSTPWRHLPNRLSPASYRRFENSLHSGSGSKGVGVSVMEDGGSHAAVAARLVSVSSSASPRKSSSLPGYYSRGSSHQQTPSFRDAFNTSRSPVLLGRQDAAPAAPPRGPTSPRSPRVPNVPASQHQRQMHQYQQQQQLQHQQHLQQMQQKQHQEQVLQQQRLQQQQQQQQYKQSQMQQQSHHQELKQQQVQQQQQQQHQKQHRHREQTPEKATAPHSEKKGKRSLLSGIFRRRKKEINSSSSSSSSSSDSEEQPPQRRSFLRRRTKKKERKELPPSATETTSTLANHGRVSADHGPAGDELLGREMNSRLLAEGSARRVRVIPSATGSLGRETQPLGIPVLTPQPGQLSKIGVSASHDSLPISFGSGVGGGSYASLGYYSGGGMGTRSSSTDTIGKKERREALKARVERLREKFRDTSSDEEKASVSSHSLYGSESSLSKSSSSNKRSRAARTERFLRRKSQELETLRKETEKDRRNREVVQARIEEIQRVREFEAERNRINEEKKLQIPEKSKPRWSAKLVYQESSEYESSIVLRTPSVSPAASPHMKAKLHSHIPPNARDAVVLRHKPDSPHTSVTVTLAPPSGMPARRSFQDFETPVQGDLKGHRSASYDSNINRHSLIMQQPCGVGMNGPSAVSAVSHSRSGLIPPTPPPRDKSRIMSPGDGRPMSFSFENINQEAQRPTSSQSSISNFTKGSSPSPSVRSVPAYIGPRSNNQPTGPPPPMVPNRRSFSEVELSSQQQAQAKANYRAPPARPAPPGYPPAQYRYTDQPPKHFQQNQYSRVQQHPQQQPAQQTLDQHNSNNLQYYTDQVPHYAKIVPVSNVPPSPSSDYSSYVSDSSVRVQQANTLWRQKEQEIKKRKTTQGVASQVLSDSSRSNSPKAEVHCSNGIAASHATHQNDDYAVIQTKKTRPPPLTLKQAESLSSLSGQSDMSSPVPKALDSDSSQGSLAKEKKKLAQNRPLSMVLEKSESAEKESPPSTPRSKPQPPKRSSKQVTVPRREAAKRQVPQEVPKPKAEHPTKETISQTEFEEIYKKEKEKLEQSKCSNYEEALKELEEIYDSLKLDNEDLLDRAERRDLPVKYQQLRADEHKAHNDSVSETGDTDSTVQDRGRSRTPKLRRAGVPDIKGDDMHYRRCLQSTRNQPDVQKALQMTGSYLLVSPAHVTPCDIDKNLPEDPMLKGQPDVVYDDVSYRNIKQANAIKVIDPQPPFGIPLGPTTQASPSDYLHVTPKENYRPKMMARKEPDTTMDDLAFRNLRKEQKDQSSKEVNLSELDEILSEANNESPMHRRKAGRSVSADRAHAMRGELSDSGTGNGASDKGIRLQTPRQVKHLNEARRTGRFFGGFRDSVTDSETNLNQHSPRHNPSWLERAHLVDNKWENLNANSSANNLSTSTETLTEISSTRAMSQPDIRQAIIREARAPPGGPLDLKGPKSVKVTSLPAPTASSVTIGTITVPKLVKVQTIQSAPASPVVLERKPYRPLDAMFNNKARPFYLTETRPEEHRQQNHVDIAKLDALISTLSKIEANDDASYEAPGAPDEPPAAEFDARERKTSEGTGRQSPSEPRSTAVSQSGPGHETEDEKSNAKASIQKAIRLSMALESCSSEGKEVSSRRRSAIDLPPRDAEPPHRSSSVSYTNAPHCLDVTLSSHVAPGPSSPERVNLAKEPQSAPVRASTCTDRVESMVVVSETVHDRARRAHSVPTSPRGSDTPVFDRGLNASGSRESDVSEAVASGCHGSMKGLDTTPRSSMAEVGSSLSELLSPQSLLSPSMASDGPQTSQRVTQVQTLLNACDHLSPASVCTLPLLAAALGECGVPEGTAGGASVRALATPPPPSVEAPPPPARSSSLPPSPAPQRGLGTSSLLHGSPSPSAEVSLETRRPEHCPRSGSAPAMGRAPSASGSDSESPTGVVRGGSLPPPHTERMTKRRRQGDAPEPRSCSAGEGADCAVAAPDQAWAQSLLAACYLLACLTQLAGIDLITAFGILLAVASVFVTFAI